MHEAQVWEFIARAFGPIFYEKTFRPGPKSPRLVQSQIAATQDCLSKKNVTFLDVVLDVVELSHIRKPGPRTRLVPSFREN